MAKRIVLLFILICSLNVNSEDLQEPMAIDEDISGLGFAVDYFKRDDGLFEYVYSLNNPSTNKGIIYSILLDMSCSASFEPANLPYEEGLQGYITGTESRDSLHTPVVIKSENKIYQSYAITVDNFVLWGVYIKPGNNGQGYRLISAAEPGLRTYRIKPWVDYTEVTWEPTDDISTLPTEEDFMVVGQIAAPGCPGETEPVTEEVNLYLGSSNRYESGFTNNLLSYKTPQKNRFHVEKGTKEITLHIYYDEKIDEQSFKVQPAWMKCYFNPIAGSNEEVTISLKKERTKFFLSVKTHKVKGSNKRKDNEEHHSFKDRDEFEIRID